MFTGLITDLWEVASLQSGPSGAELRLRAGRLAPKDVAVGDSIAVSGVCLTVTSISGGLLSFDVSAESLKSTTLGELRPGRKVNIERALSASGRFGGHMVTGHVDGVGIIRSVQGAGNSLRLEVAAPPEVLRYLVPKGSVALDGISLTVVEVLAEGFTLVIIPHTSGVTTLGSMQQGQRVNLESDIIGKYVYSFLVRQGGGPDRGAAGKAGDLGEALRRGGFMA